MPGDPFPPRSAIHSHQICQLQELLQAVVPANAFYTAKFRAVDVDAKSASLETLARFPFTTKSELIDDQTTHPPFGTNLTYPLDQFTRYHQTSGTSGTPLRWLDTPQSWEWMLDRWLEIFRAAEVRQGDRIVFAFSFGPFIGFWLAFEAGGRLGALCLPAGGLSSLARLAMIMETRATVLCCTPTYALRLGEAALEAKLDLTQACVRRIIVAGEPGGSIPATRTHLATLWPGARVFDHHGMTETGPVTYECPARPGFLHVMESGFVAEIIEPTTGHAVEPGQTGELVLTTLGRVGTPLIRYRTGDLVREERRVPRLALNGQRPTSDRKGAQSDSGSALFEGGPCLCGRQELVLQGGILGRVDDMVIVRGVNVYPAAVEDVLRACGGIAEYQVTVSRSRSLNELAIAIEPDATCRDVQGLVGRVKQRLQNALTLRVPVEAVPCGSLPRYEMKAKRWVTQ